MNAVVLAVLISAPAGALVTSFAEYKKKYNLYDLVKDTLAAVAVTVAYVFTKDKETVKARWKGLVAKVKGEVVAVENVVKSDVKKVETTVKTDVQKVESKL